MEATEPSALYLRLMKKVSIRPERSVTLGQVSRLLAPSEKLEQELSELVLYRHHKGDGNRVVIDLLQIVRVVREAAPELSVEAYGDPQVLIMISPKPQKPRIAVLIFAWLLLFFGAGLAIMNFHTDVSMKEVHIRIVELLTGKRTDHPLWFQIPYSIGIGLGMILFFNHLFKKRFNEEPNPLEVELYTYQENVNAYVIADEMRKKTASTESGEKTMGDWLMHLFVMLLGLSGGLAVGSGLVAFLIILDLIPRLAQIAYAYRVSVWFETAVICGSMYWTFADFMDWRLTLPKAAILTVSGLLTGMFVGMLAGALTEVMNVLPILAKRMNLSDYLVGLVMAMVLGKTLGSLFDWLYFQW